MIISKDHPKIITTTPLIIHHNRNNHMSRNYISSVSRDFDAIETSNEREPSWVKEFENNLQKDAVKSKREDYALYEQINSIVGNKSIFSSVEEKVLDMQKRTGLYDLINQTKVAQLSEGTKSIFEEVPELKTFIDNYIQDHPGTSVEAIIHDILKINKIRNRLPDGDDVPEEIKRHISDMLANSQKEKMQHNFSDDVNFGKADYSDDEGLDNDPFSSLEADVQK